MSEDNLSNLYQTLVGLKGPISNAIAQRKNCHFHVGETLNLVRDQYRTTLTDAIRDFFDKTVPALNVTIPRPGDTAIWTADTAESWRLYSQLDAHLATAVARTKNRSPRTHHVDGRTVFVVHGHDEAARESVARFLERLTFTPLILHEQANSGKTIVEKLEAHSDVAFAVVLLTPDDQGRLKGTEKLFGRARQNVILELGYFIGLLGRRNVCALHKGDIEIPSDYLGVLFTPIDTAGAWKLLLAKEMKAAGLVVDLNLAM